jgi:hypothetical protein
MVPGEALELLRAHPPERVVLSNRHHYRQADLLVDEFGCQVFCPEAGLDEFTDGDRVVEPYAYGDEVAPGLFAHEIGSICPDDAALELRRAPGVVAFADGLMHHEGGLHFVSDGLLADDPADVDDVKHGLFASLERLLGLDFEVMLFAHGEPIASGGRRTLANFLDTPG